MASNNAKPIMQHAIAQGIQGVTESNVEILALKISTRRLQAAGRRLSGGIECDYQVTFPTSFVGSVFTAASINIVTVMSAITEKASSFGLTVRVTGISVEEPQAI